ncbi:LsbB family leaderless bacteriocin, partial [Enterococcus faecium]|uniref:LsbB family leaderless bacteriocin n=2 Tax=Enterococcus TaxID=1350 RepID=UPI00387E112A
MIKSPTEIFRASEKNKIKRDSFLSHQTVDKKELAIKPLLFVYSLWLAFASLIGVTGISVQKLTRYETAWFKNKHG